MKNYLQIDPNNYVLETDDPKVLDFYTNQNHCCICGHELSIEIKQDAGIWITEEASCLSCDTKNRKNTTRSH